MTLRLQKYLVAFLIIVIPLIASTEYLWGKAVIVFLDAILLLSLGSAIFSLKHVGILRTLVNTALLFFLFFLILTLAPLPLALVKIISPGTIGIYNNSMFFKPLSVCPYRTFIGFGVTTVCFSVFFVLINFFDSIKFRFKLARYIVFSSFFISILGILSMYFQNGKLFWINDIVSGSPTGPFINTIHFSHFLVLSIPISLCLWIGKIDFHFGIHDVHIVKSFFKKVIIFFKYSLFYLLPAFVMAFGLFKAGSRGAVVALGVSLFVLLVLLFLNRSKGRSILLIAAVLLSLIIVMNFMDDENLKKVKTLKSPFNTSSAEIRLSVWKDTLNVFKSFPVVGTGINTFENIFPKYKTIFGSGKMKFTHTENDYIETISEVGVIGAGLILFIIYVFTRNVYLNYARVKDSRKKILLIGGISSCAGILTGAMTDFIFHIPVTAIFVTIICFIIWPKAKNRGRYIELDKISNKKGFIVLVSLCYILGAIFLVFSLKVGIGQFFFYRYVHSSGSFIQEEKFLKSAVFFDDMNPEYFFDLGKMYFNQAGILEQTDKKRSLFYLNNALKKLDKAIRLEPTNWEYYLYDGAANLRLSAYTGDAGKKEKAKEYFEKAKFFNPTEYSLYEYIGGYYLSVEPKKAFDNYKILLELRPRYFNRIMENIWKRIQNPEFVRLAVPDKADYVLKYAEFLDGKNINAEKFYREAATLSEQEPSDMKARIARNLAKKGYYKEASECILGAIKSKETLNSADDFTGLPKANTSELIRNEELIAQYGMDPSKISQKDLLYKKALFYYQIGDYNKSIDNFKELVALAPEELKFKSNLSFVLYAKGSFKESYYHLNEIYLKMDTLNKDNNVY